MKKEKLTLSGLKIKSFVTSLSNKESQYIKGGTGTLPTNAACNTDQTCESVQVCSEYICSEDCQTNTESNTEQCITDDGEGF